MTALEFDYLYCHVVDSGNAWNKDVVVHLNQKLNDCIKTDSLHQLKGCRVHKKWMMQ